MLEKDYCRVARSFMTSIWTVIPFSLLFNGMVVFDTFGDALGWRRAIWAPIALLLVLCFVIYGALIHPRIYRSGGERSQAQTTSSSSKGEKMHGSIDGEVLEMPTSPHNTDSVLHTVA